ncbi:MAG: flagellar hook-length control protein FliK [bacterium]
MRIGEALDRLFSPGGSDDGAAETRASDAADAEAFRSAFESALDRRSERAGAGGFDAAAAIVIDPRFVLSLGSPAQPFEAGGEFDAQSARAAEEFHAREAGDRPMRGTGESRDGRNQGEAVAPESSAAADSDDSAQRVASATAQSDEARAGTAQNGDEPDGGAQTRDGAAADTATRDDSAMRSVEEVARQIASSAESAESEIEGAHDAAIAPLTAAAELESAARAPKSDSSGATGTQPADVAQPIARAEETAFDTRDGSDDSGTAPRAPTLLTGGGVHAPAVGAASFAAALANQIAAIGGGAAGSASVTGELANSSPASAVERVEQNSILTRLSEGVGDALRAGKREVVVRLSPPNLGVVRIRFEFDEQRLSARVEVSDPAVHRALESGLAELKSVLRQHAVELADLSLASGDGRGGEERGGRSPEEDGRDDAARFATATQTSPVSERRRAPHRAGGLDITA